MPDLNVYQMSDEMIGQIAKVIQVAILSGTDVVDHLRMMKFTTIGEAIHLTGEYKEQFEKNIQSMMEEVSSSQES